MNGEDAFAGITEPPPPDDQPGTFDEEILFRLDALLELPHPVDKLSPVRDVIMLCVRRGLSRYCYTASHLYPIPIPISIPYPHPHSHPYPYSDLDPDLAPRDLQVYLEGKDVIKVVHSLASGAEPSQFAFDQEALIAHGA